MGLRLPSYIDVYSSGDMGGYFKRLCGLSSTKFINTSPVLILEVEVYTGSQ